MKLSLLGSTGSIGTQTLEVLRQNNCRPQVLTANKNIKLLERQAREFSPDVCCVADETLGKQLKIALGDAPIKVHYGDESILYAATYEKSEVVLNALVGLSGIKPTVVALSANRKLLLANKESLVIAGSHFSGSQIIPVDSEHSAIFQCLQAGRQGLNSITLTASGGIFRGYTKDRLRTVTPEKAKKNPNWDMGVKVTVDSALLLNKGYEFIEAMYLFDLKPEQINVLIHPQSIVHSFIEYNDGAVIAQLGVPDMKLPIQYALFYPARKEFCSERLNLAHIQSLSFNEPDYENFPCLSLAIDAAKKGGNSGAILCGAGERAVLEFLEGRLNFIEVSERIQTVFSKIHYNSNPTIDELIDTAKYAYDLGGL